MSDTADAVATIQAQDASSPDVSSPPSPPKYSCPEQPPPPYSASSGMYSPPKTHAPPQHSAYESFRDINPEEASDQTPLLSSVDDRTVRRGFIRKVFCIVTLQLLFTFSVVCVFTFSSVVKEAVQTHLWAYLSSYIIFLVVAFSLQCFRSFSQRHPWNIVGLSVVTVSMSYMVGTVASFHNTAAVVVTMGVTIAVTLAVIAFTAQTRYDFTIFYGVMLVLVVDLFMFGFFCTFLYSYMADIGYGCLGALVFSLFLVIDCQLVLGRGSYALSEEDYINAALNIYLDIILIFLYLLGSRR
ncbi:protein lifeguard 1 [Mugil cephalus]|uniref:protein lifeguard 1 n=1 Tax=Mugil cephalus TaxID=48193 RepID=UPI001FB71B1A|nr:protein lifeguard 1 [Mugil cephalus]